MKKITVLLSEVVSEAFEKAGYSSDLGTVSVSDRMDLCQFQCNGAFAGAKLYHKAPFMIAEEVAAILSENTMFSKAEAVKPGFINLTLTDEFLLEYVNGVVDDPNLGVPQVETPETIIIDYAGPNVAKPLHIGHLRSSIIGESLKRIARATGRTVVGDAHLGDWGTPLGLVIAEYQERHPEWACFQEGFDPERDGLPEIDVNELNEIYPFASAKSKEDEEFKEKAHKIVYQFQHHHPGYYSLWKQIVEVSKSDIKKILGKLNVDLDYWYGESDCDAYTDELISRLTEKGLLYESDGAQVVDVAEESDKITVPPVMIKKSDDSSAYATTDLATIIQREKDFKPSKIWYVVDKRQSLHFTQVFRCARKAELVPDDTELTLIGFGTMNGSDGKPFKTRAGGVMRLEELIKMATDGALEKLQDSEYVSGDKQEIAEKIGVAAIKFGDLSNQPSKDYVFDLNKFLAFDGKTGTYLLYTVTRINSILKKAGISYDEARPIGGIYSDVERELALDFALLGETYDKAYTDLAPCVLCDSAYNIASTFSRLYHDEHILSEPDEQKRNDLIALCLMARRVIAKQLDLLAIETVENM